MQPVLIVSIVLGVLSLGWAIASFRVIPQASTAVVERYGRYTRTLAPGINIVIPFIDSIRNRIDMREQVVPFPPQPVITQDNLVASIDTVVYYRVTDARAATYEVASYIQAIEQLSVTALRNIVGGMDLEQTLASRELINSALFGVLDEATGRWGIHVNRVVLKAIEPPISIQDSMEKQMRADRDKRAAIITAEGIRQATILKAEGERQAAKLKAQSDREVAEILAGNTESERDTPPQRPFPDLRSTHKPLRPGDPRTLGRYRLTARLGHGGMGTVFLGRSPGERLVAVKVIQDDYVDDPTFRDRFKKEIAAVRKVGGFHTASVVDAHPEGSPPWLATEYVPGPSLQYVLATAGPLPMPTVHTLAVGIAEALEG
ncbi:SPFH domain-containing protein [Streptomyces sp. NPDC051677]|uniref:SPFH domain-containing protein n=1 Tax=Streptomyces sp. NPDC051677 TaxID=3365669 RepID=UPI0037D47037